MFNRFLLLITSLFLAACATPIKPMNVCTQPVGMPAIIKYGDAYINVNPPVMTVKKNKYLRFKLDGANQPGPNGIDYEELKVTVVARDATNKTWVNFTKTEKELAPTGIFEVCMPDDQPLATFKYDVKVDTHGNLDPRVRVIP